MGTPLLRLSRLLGSHHRTWLTLLSFRGGTRVSGMLGSDFVDGPQQHCIADGCALDNFIGLVVPPGKLGAND